MDVLSYFKPIPGLPEAGRKGIKARKFFPAFDVAYSIPFDTPNRLVVLPVLGRQARSCIQNHTSSVKDAIGKAEIPNGEGMTCRCGRSGRGGRNEERERKKLRAM